MIDMAQEIHRLIANRNRALLCALDLCIEQLAHLPSGDPAIQYALECAREAAQQERYLQARVGVS
jgi:hypothetical protein